VVRVRNGRRTVLARGSQPYAAFGARFALVTEGGEGDVRIERVDYATRGRRVLWRGPELPSGLELSADERHAAFVAQDIRRPDRGVPTRLVSLATRSFRVRSRPIPESRAGTVVWLDARRFVSIPPETGARAQVSGTDLRPRGSLPAWPVSSVAVLPGGRIRSVDGVGRLWTARPPGRPARRGRTLPAEGGGTLVALPGAPRLVGASRRVPRPGSLGGAGSARHRTGALCPLAR